MSSQPDPLSFLPLKNDTLYIILALASRPMHGYAIIRDVEERSDRAVILQTGALYRTLRQMLRDRLIEECETPVGEKDHDDRRRYYRVTALGNRVLDAEIARMRQLIHAARLTTTGKRPRLA
jgi:DNA-binding PadR family transcriptional regulator